MLPWSVMRGGGLTDFGEVLGQLVDVAGTVEERVVGVEMEVRELCGHKGMLSLCSLRKTWS